MTSRTFLVQSIGATVCPTYLDTHTGTVLTIWHDGRIEVQTIDTVFRFDLNRKQRAEILAFWQGFR